MKKLLIITLLIASSNIFASEVYWMKAIELDVKVNSSNWSGWEKIDYPIDVKFSFTDHRIIVYTETLQIIDYNQLTSITTNDYILYKSLGTDTNYNFVEIQLYLYKKLGIVILKIAYSDLEYKYKLIFN